MLLFFTITIMSPEIPLHVKIEIECTIPKLHMVEHMTTKIFLKHVCMSSMMWSMRGHEG